MADKINLKEITDVLYSSYLARDFFAKVIPGTVLLVFLIYAVYGAPELSTVTNGIHDVPYPAWILFYGICWVAGIAVQAVGGDTAYH